MTITPIEQDALLVLQALAEWSQGENDPNFGNYQVSSDELQAKLGITSNRINDAVEHLLDLGYANRYQTFGTHPYSFREVWLETPGKVAYQRTRAQTENRRQEDPAKSLYDVFLSHSSLDDALIADVKRLLEANGIRTFATPGSVPTGSWEPQIEKALQSSASVWVLLTPNALRESVWAHHEFGYFYGYAHGRGRDPQGHSCRFLYTRGTELRGLYAWIQGTRIDSFENPAYIGEVIADGIGREFKVHEGWVSRNYPIQPAVPERHPLMGPVSFSSSGLKHGPGTAEVMIGINRIDETVYYVDALTAHPETEITSVMMADVVGPSYPGSVVLRLQYRASSSSPLPTKLADRRGRAFSVLRGTRAPGGKTPLLVTFETDDGRALAAVFYYTVSRHSKGFPELNLHAAIPMDWRLGEMPSPSTA